MSIRLALVGAGRMGATHARVLAGRTDVRVAVVCDSSRSRAQRVGDPLDARATDDLDEVLADTRIDAVVVATPTPTHADVVSACARAGKHVFVEKPVAADLAGAERVVREVEAAGIQCQVGFHRRWDRSYREAKRAIDDGEIGVLEGFRAVSRDREPPSLAFLRSSGGLMVDLAIHDLDSARFFLGEVEEVHAIGAVQAVPDLRDTGAFDAAVATLRFENGALGTLEAGLRTAYAYEIRMEILGSKGRLHIEQEPFGALTRYGPDGARYALPQGFEERFADAYAEEVLGFVRSLTTGEPVAPSAADARETLRLAIAAQRSLSTGEHVRVRDVGRQEGDTST